ncbi:MAG: glycosyltransferase [Synergistaceae bacterium]|nr:glycosyltransferase [Synergistaceae bacterium]
MKVLHYVNENSLSWVRSWVRLLERLEKLGVENVVVCKSGKTLGGILQQNNIRCIEADVLFADLPATAFKFAQAVRSTAPHLIHTRLSSGARIGGWWGRKLGIPVFSTLDKFAKIKYYRDCTLLAACSEAVRHYAIDNGFPRERTTVIYNSLDYTRYRLNKAVGQETRKKLKIPSDWLLITASGRFDEGKGFELLLRSYKNFSLTEAGRRTKLLLLGDGPYRDRLEKLALELDIAEKVIMPGFVEDVRPWLWGSDIFVFPSDRPDAFGLSLLEAMAAELPLVASDCGGPGELVKDGKSGLLVPPGNESALCSALLKLATDHALQTSLAEKAVLRAGDFSVDSVAAATADCYRKILEDGNV